MWSSLLWQATIGLLITCTAVDLPAQQRERDRDRGGEAERDTQPRERIGDRQREEDRGDRDRQSRLVHPQLLLPQPDREGYWYLGVDVKNRDHGAQITRVERQSPAQRAGFEIRDVIVTVNGYQVGRVDGRLYPLGRELELRADRRGRVLLLVQDRRNGQLTPMSVRLEPVERRRDPIRSQSLIGTISLERIASLPRGTVLTVRLLDVTGRRLPARTIAQRTYRELGPLPIPFELTYDTDHIEPSRKYALDAEATVNGFAALRTPKRYPVLETERQGRVNMVLEPVRR